LNFDSGILFEYTCDSYFDFTFDFDGNIIRTLTSDCNLNFNWAVNFGSDKDARFDLVFDLDLEFDFNFHLD
jgi:hypothetical protein